MKVIYYASRNFTDHAISQKVKDKWYEKMFNDFKKAGKKIVEKELERLEKAVKDKKTNDKDSREYIEVKINALQDLIAQEAYSKTYTDTTAVRKDLKSLGFRDMTKRDYAGYAGAEDDSMIKSLDVSDEVGADIIVQPEDEIVTLIVGGVDFAEYNLEISSSLYHGVRSLVSDIKYIAQMILKDPKDSKLRSRYKLIYV
jgi:hypothetical protein